MQGQETGRVYDELLVTLARSGDRRAGERQPGRVERPAVIVPAVLAVVDKIEGAYAVEANELLKNANRPGFQVPDARKV